MAIFCKKWHNNNQIYLRHEFDGKPLDRNYVQATLKMLHKITKRTIKVGTTAIIEHNVYGNKTTTKQNVDYSYDGDKFKQNPTIATYAI